MATLVLRDSGSLASPGATAKGSPLTNLEVDNNFSNLNIAIGVNSNLTTTTANTANLVLSINELVSKIAVVNANVGLATSLTTGNTTNVVAAINELNSNKGATAATYGSSSQIPVITINAKGFITSAANASVAGVTSFSNAAPAGFVIQTSDGSTYRANANISGVTASTYGGSTATPVIVVDQYGRITSASNVTSGVSISNDTASTGTTFYPLLSSITTGTLSAANVSSSKLLYQPSTGNLTASIFTVTGSDLPTNGIYLPTTNTLGFVTNRTEDARFDSVGRFLIANTTGTQQFVVSGNSQITGNVFLSTLNTSTFVGVGTAAPTDKFHVIGNILCTNTVTAVDFNSTSDENVKENVVVINHATDIVQQLEGVEFTWKNSGVKSAGFIAQRIEEVLPHLVHLNSEGTKTLNYNGIIAYLVQTVKELDARIQMLENR